MDGEKKIDSNLHQTDTRVIDVILYTKSNEMPSAHMFLGSSFQKVQLMQLRHFWIFEIDNLSPDITSFELHSSFTCLQIEDQLHSIQCAFPTFSRSFSLIRSLKTKWYHLMISLFFLIQQQQIKILYLSVF